MGTVVGEWKQWPRAAVNTEALGGLEHIYCTPVIMAGCRQELPSMDLKIYVPMFLS